MSDNGYKTAIFGWTSRDGYGYTVRETNEGYFTLHYQGDDKEENPMFDFNEADADGIIEAMQDAVKFHREQEGK